MKLASLLLVLGGSLLVVGVASAQDTASPAYASPQPQPVYASAPAPAEGAPGTIKDRSAHDRPISLSAQAYIPWWYGFGIGVRLGGEIPIVKDGFISSINDSVSIEPNLFLAYSTYYAWDNGHLGRYTPAVSMLWNFHLKPNLTVYGMASIGVEIQRENWDNYAGNKYHHTTAYAFVELAGGVKWHFSERVAVRAELGWYGPRGGISFDL
ncbi:MAG TPA: hypothetical protein VI299_29795 [Polyangiales bacterium]